MQRAPVGASDMPEKEMPSACSSSLETISLSRRRGAQTICGAGWDASSRKMPDERHGLLQAALIFVLCLLYLAVAATTSGQVKSESTTPSARSLITQTVRENDRAILPGNTHPLARPEFDRGLVSPSMLLQHLFLVLQRSPEQAAALQKLLDEQQDRSSPIYHKWLTPVEFGQRFGPSDQDIQTVVQWLESRGLQVASIANGRVAIEFSGTVAQVQQAFHTEIHNYDVNGNMHWANSSDPQIPAALAPVVVGVAALHDFKPKPMSHSVRIPGLKANGRTARRSFTYPDYCSLGTSGCEPAVGPADIATIYSVASVWYAGYTGTGQTIAVMGQATIQTSDITAFRQLFDVQQPSSIPTVISLPNFGPPSQAESLASGDEGESVLDLEWSGAVAPGAQIEFVTSGNVVTSAFCAIDGFPSSSSQVSSLNACAYPTEVVRPRILSLSYGTCEQQLGSAGNQFINSAWQQAATEGIAVVVATGDEGSAACDGQTAPASRGLAVNGLASTPYDIAVGGTDFNDLKNPSKYWSPIDANGTQESAKGYIPETTYNDSCTNIVWNGVVPVLTSNPEANCNQSPELQVGSQSQPVSFGQYIAPFGGGGGMSSVYPKPAWQVAPGVPNDGKRDIPDVSLFAGNGLTGTYYVVCQYDSNGPPDLSGNPTSGTCDLSTGAFSGAGGTSASAQVFAGILALVNQENGFTTGQGSQNVDTALYNLAQQQSPTSCSTGSPASNCVFNDVTAGTISAPCVNASLNCVLSSSSDTIGILDCCDASAGYDLATGLGSVNAANLASGWKNATTGSTAPDFWLSVGAGNATVVIPTSGNSGSFTFTVTQVNAFAGTFTDTSIYSCSGLPTLSTCAFAANSDDATHTTVTVTVSTAASSLTIPASQLRGVGWWRASGPISLACILCALILILGLRWGNRRFIPVTALLIFVFVLMGAEGCGGRSGGGIGGTGFTPAGFYTPIVSVTSGGVTHSLNFNLNVR